MNIVYYTRPPYLDCDLPLINELREKKIKLLVLIDLPPYYLSSTVIDIKKQLNRNGILSIESYKEFMLYKDYFDTNSVCLINRTKKSVLNPRNWIVSIIVFRKILKFKADIIHNTSILGISELLLFYFRKKIVITQHDPFPHSGEFKRLNYFLGIVNFRFIKYYILLNSNQRERFIDTYKLSPENVFQSNLGIYTVLDLFKKENISKESYSILFFGRIFPYKGLEYLLEAMEDVYKAVPEIKLIIAGESGYDIDLDGLKAKPYLQIINRFIPVDELVILIQRTQFSVCPYLDATQSGVIMSCFNFNQPVIATNVGGLIESVEDEVTGIIVPPKDTKSLSNAIIQLINNPKKIKDMEENISRIWHRGDKAWENISNGVVDCYSKIVS